MEGLIGFQVVDKDNDIHPDMDGSFCIYTLEDATKMYNQHKTKWRLLPIFDGDVEDPTFCFDGADKQQLFTRSEVETKLFELGEYYGASSCKQDMEDFNQWMKDYF